MSRQGDFTAAGEPGRKEVTMDDRGEVRILLQTQDDQVDEANGAVAVTLNNGNGYLSSSARSASVRVMDDETSEVNFVPDQTEATVGENSGRHEDAVAISPAPTSP